MITPTHPYWPLTPGSRIDYRAFVIEGYWHTDTMSLDVNKRDLDTNQIPFSRTCIEVPKHRRPEIAVVGSNSGHVPTMADDWGNYVYYMGLWKPADGSPGWIGEVGDSKSESDPPDPELSLNPIAGERITVNVTGVDFAPDGTATRNAMKAVYGTIGFGPWWWADTYPDTLRTALIERPDEPTGWVYNYLWAKGIGPVDMWWGMRDATGHVKGWEWQATGHG